jgi:predicted component of type VI protein secretion system
MFSILVPAWVRPLAPLVMQERTGFLEFVPSATDAGELGELPMFVLGSRYSWDSRLRKNPLCLVRD